MWYENEISTYDVHKKWYDTYDMLTSAEKTPGIDEDRRIKVAEA